MGKLLNLFVFFLNYQIKNKKNDTEILFQDQEYCTDSGFMSLEKNDKPIFLKELDKLWKQKPQYSASNTLLVDDEPCKALLNPVNC